MSDDLDLMDGYTSRPRGVQERPACEVCGKWKRTDHACPGPQVEDPFPVASTRGLVKRRTAG